MIHISHKTRHVKRYENMVENCRKVMKFCFYTYTVQIPYITPLEMNSRKEAVTARRAKAW
jgi:hypothetical protein